MEALNTRKNPLGGRLSRGADTLAKLRRFPSRFQELEQEVQETQRLHQRVGDYPNVLAEGGVNFWEAFRLIPVGERFWHAGLRSAVCRSGQ